jgi:hypothetical protein
MSLRYVHLKHGEYLFKEGDGGDKRFFGIIKGRISIRTRVRVKPTLIKQEIKNIENSYNENLIPERTFIEKILNSNKEQMKEVTAPSRRSKQV